MWSLEALVLGPLSWLIRSVTALLAYFAKKPDTAIALFALIVSVLTVYFAREALRDQHRHNILSVKPLPMVTVFSGQEKLEVVLHNNGSGPMIIKDIDVYRGEDVKKSVIDWMPDLPEGMRWDAFASAMSDRSLAPEGEIALVRLTGKQTEPAFREARDKCRDALSSLTVKVGYTDIYESPMPLHVRNLSLFGRHK